MVIEKYKYIWDTKRDEIKHYYIFTDINISTIAEKYKTSRSAIMGFCNRQWGSRKKAKIAHGILDKSPPVGRPKTRPPKAKSQIKQPAKRTQRIKHKVVIKTHIAQEILPTDKQCRFPMGEAAPYDFCTSKATHGHYCQKHHKMCHRGVPIKYDRRIISWNKWHTKPRQDTHV